MQTQASPAEPTGGSAAVGAPRDLYLFTSVVQESDGYTVGYANSAETHALSWISLVRADGSRATWEHALAPSGTVKLRAAPHGGDSLHFHVDKPGLPGASWEVMAAWAAGAENAEGPPPPAAETLPEDGDAPPEGFGQLPAGAEDATAGVPCWQWFHIDRVERVLDRYVVGYSRRFGDFQADNCFVRLHDRDGKEIAWDWARGQSGALSLPCDARGAFLVYFACHVLWDPYKTAIPVHRWNL